MSLNLEINNEDIIQQLKILRKTTEIVEQVAIKKIIEREAALLGLTIKKEELQKASDEFRVANKLSHAKNTMVWLEKNGLSMKDFEEIIHTNLLKKKMMDELFAEEARSYFYKNQSSYRKAVLYEIIVEDFNLALEIFYSIRESEITFSEAAIKYSGSLDSKRKRGYLGLINSASLKASVSSAVFASTPPQLLKPIVTSLGSHIVFVEEIITPELSDNLEDEITEELLKRWALGKIKEYVGIDKMLDLWKEQ